MLTLAELDSAVTFPSVSVWDLHTQTKADTLVTSGNSYFWATVVQPQHPPSPPTARSFRTEQTSRLTLNNSLAHVEQCPRKREPPNCKRWNIHHPNRGSAIPHRGMLFWVPIRERGLLRKMLQHPGWFGSFNPAKERLLSNQHHQQAKHKDDSIDSFQGPFHHPPNLLTWLSLQGDCKTSQKWVPSRCVCPLALWFRAQIF